MHTVSFVKEALNITIHNQYPSSELISPVYFSTGTTCHVSPSQKTNTGTTMEASFGIVSKQTVFEGATLNLRTMFNEHNFTQQYTPLCP
jgi:Zn finger protein HypA/HybF involved in hydrogenase expression